MTPTPDLHHLAGIDTRPHPTVSLYLALDQSRDGRLGSLAQLTKLKEHEEQDNGGARAWSLAADDLERIQRFVEELPLGAERGLALFACQEAGLFSAHTLPVAVPNLMELGPGPYLRPLAALAGDFCPSLVVVMDRRRARFFAGQLGELEELEELELASEETSTQRDGGQGRAGDKRTSRRADEALAKLCKDVGGTLMEAFRPGGYRQLLVGGSKSAFEALVPGLHPYLAERLVGTFSCEAGAGLGQVAQEVLRLQPAARRVRQERLLAKLADNLGPGGQAATGLNQVLAALHGGQVHTMFVRRGGTAPGGSCPSCNRLRHTAGACPLCGEEMTPVADVINLAVAQALASGAALEQVDGDSALDGLDGVAALLRYA